MQTFRAKLYGAGLPLAGEEVEAFLTDTALRIGARSISEDIRHINMRIGGFEHTDIFLNWTNLAGKPYSLQPLTRQDTDTVIATAPSPLKEQFAQWHNRKRTIRMVWGTLGSLTATVMLTTILVWWHYDKVVAWVASHVSIANEQRLGESVLAQIAANGDIIKEGVAVDAIKMIGQPLTTGSPYQYRWLIQKEKSINAFALPGGIIIVNSGLLTSIDNADELAAVLAHEVQHVEQRHALQSVINSLGWAAALMVILGDVNAATAVIAHQIGNMYFSRDREDEADRLGYHALVQAKIKPDGMVTLLQKLKKGSAANMPEWLSSHPDIDLRIATIQNMIRKEPCPECQSIALAWEPVKLDIKPDTDAEQCRD